MQSKKILVIGSLNMDMVVEIKRMPLEGETILGKSLKYIPGGKGANQACAVAKLGGDVSMIGRVGDDEFSKILCDSLKESGVNISHIEKMKGITTGTAIINVFDNGNNSIIVIAGANEKCDVDYISTLNSVIQEADIIILQMEIPYEAVYYAIDFAKNSHKTVILNPAPAPDYIPDEILQKIDFITPNETELEKLTGIKTDDNDGIMAAAQSLINRGVKNVIATLGSKGALHVTNYSQRLYPVEKVKVIDTTAAGDTFNGALAVYLAENHTIEDAILFANKVAAISVTRKGAQTSIPTRQEV